VKKCKRCDSVFSSIRSNHIFCSPGCKRVQSKLDKRIIRSKLTDLERIEINKKQRDKRTKKIFSPINCNCCREEVVPKTSLNIYCSITCSNFINKKLRNNLRSRLNKAIKKDYRTGSAVSDLGCSIDEFKIYMENLFEEGMTWNNWSRLGWHIDHIKALANFDLTVESELKKAVHYTNLQPMWAKDNLKKGTK